MDLGQLLGGAGVIATRQRQTEEDMRTAQRNQLAIEEQNRLNQLRREMLAAPPVQAPQYDFGGTQYPIDGMQAGAPAQAPAQAPAPTPPGFAQLDPNSPQARAMYQQRLERLRGEQTKATGVPVAVPGGPIKAGVVGVPELDIGQAPPDASRFQQTMATVGAKGKINTTLYDISTKLATGKYAGVPATGGLSGITNYFTGTPAESALRDRAIKANDWYMSEAARTYFQQNPKLLVDAKKDPVTFYEKVAKGVSAMKAAETPAPLPPSKKATKYDQAQTPYNDLITQSAQQYGIDPTIFKRLLGSESSFSPTAVSPRGAKYGLGIAQIASSHGLPREAMLDPNQAIPFAAQLFSQYVQQSGGNYEQALMKYKGASTERGRASMAAIVKDILSGTQPAPTAPTAPAQVAIGAGAMPLPGQPGAQTQPQPLPGRPEDLQAQPRMYAGQSTVTNPFIPAAQAATPTAQAPAQAPNVPTARDQAGFYMANPQSIPVEMQRANQMRGEMERLAGMYQRAGMGNQYMEARAKIIEIDNSMTYLQGMQGLQEFQLGNDPRRLGAVWSQYAGVPVGIQPRADGKYNIIVNGQKTKEGISAADISDAARSAFDQTYRQQKATAGAAYSMEAFKSQLTAQLETVKQQAQMVREATVEAIKGRNKVMEIRLGREDFDIKPVGDGTARAWVYNKAGTALGVMDARTGEFVEMDGIKVPVGPSYRGVTGTPAGVSGNVR